MEATPDATEQALIDGDPVVFGQRQSSLLDIAQRANTATDAWPLAEDAAVTAAAVLGLSSYGYARLAGDTTDEINLRFGDVEGGAGLIEIQFSTAPDRSAIAYALHTVGPIVVADLDEELRFSDHMLCRRAIRSALISPLTHDQRKFGAIGAFGRRPHTFSVDDVCYFELLSRLISSTLARVAAERELQEQRQLTNKMLETTDALVVKLSPQLRIQTVNRAFSSASGFDCEEVTDRAISSAVLDSNDMSLVKQAFDRVRGGEESVKFESGLLTKDGQRRQVAWSYAPLTRADGVVEALLGTGVDITDQCHALARLEQVERIAKAATQRLNDLHAEVQRRNATPADAAGPSDSPQDDDRERRRNLRVPFPRMQEIAPIIDGKLPDRSRLLQVRCHDISAGGFSFFLPTLPDFEELVVALGEGDQRKYLTARILHVRAAELDGRPMQLVGCGYSGRLELISNSKHGDYFVVMS